MSVSQHAPGQWVCEQVGVWTGGVCGQGVCVDRGCVWTGGVCGQGVCGWGCMDRGWGVDRGCVDGGCMNRGCIDRESVWTGSVDRGGCGQRGDRGWTGGVDREGVDEGAGCTLPYPPDGR